MKKNNKIKLKGWVDLPGPLVDDFFNVFDASSWIDSQARVGWIIDEDEFASMVDENAVSECFESAKWLMWSVVTKVPEQVEKMNFVVHQQKEKEGSPSHWAVFNLAPALGLPGIDPIKEMNELKEFFLFLKQMAWEDPTQKYSLMFYQERGDFGVRLEGKQAQKAEEKTKEMKEKINASPLLTQWVQTLLKGIKNMNVPNHVVWSSTSLSDLIEFKEQQKYFLQSEGVNSWDEWKEKKKATTKEVRRGFKRR